VKTGLTWQLKQSNLILLEAPNALLQSMTFLEALFGRNALEQLHDAIFDRTHQS
jgi:hypothetical protein